MDARHEQQDELNGLVRKNNPWYVQSWAEVRLPAFKIRPCSEWLARTWPISELDCNDISSAVVVCSVEPQLIFFSTVTTLPWTSASPSVPITIDKSHRPSVVYIVHLLHTASQPTRLGLLWYININRIWADHHVILGLLLLLLFILNFYTTTSKHKVRSQRLSQQVNKGFWG